MSTENTNNTEVQDKKTGGMRVLVSGFAIAVLMFAVGSFALFKMVPSSVQLLFKKEFAKVDKHADSVGFARGFEKGKSFQFSKDAEALLKATSIKSVVLAKPIKKVPVVKKQSNNQNYTASYGTIIGPRQNDSTHH